MPDEVLSAIKEALDNTNTQNQKEIKRQKKIAERKAMREVKSLLEHYSRCYIEDIDLQKLEVFMKHESQYLKKCRKDDCYKKYSEKKSAKKKFLDFKEKNNI